MAGKIGVSWSYGPKPEEYGFRVDSEFPHYDVLDKIVWLEASEKELECILRQIQNIPLATHWVSFNQGNGTGQNVNNTTMRWYGDIAKFIAFNMDLTK